MSNYYKYNFVSPDPIYATVKEELKSYFDTGAVDDLLFPTYLNKSLEKLGRTTYVISEQILHIEDFEARLPDNFYAVKEAWMCARIPGNPYPMANSFYAQGVDSTTVQVSPVITNSQGCTNVNCQEVDCNGVCDQLVEQNVYKTTNEIARSYKYEYLLKPGNISARQNCDVKYRDDWNKFEPPLREFTPGASGYDSFDIRDNKFVTNFRKGVVHLLYYATEYDTKSNQLIPDNYRIKEYIEAFLKFKMIETLSNQIVDETFNQIQQKLVYYKQEYNEAYILADIEIKKQTVWQKQHRIKKDLNRFNRYELPNRTNRFGRRRNN